MFEEYYQGLCDFIFLLFFDRLFTIVGDLVMKPTFMRNLDEEFYVATFEEQSLQQKVKDFSPCGIGQR